MTTQKLIFFIYLGLILLMSLIAFCLYGNDKKRAKNGMDRIKEKTLLSISCYNGGIGALIGRIVFHHKTDKSYFSIVIILSTLIQLATLCLLCYLAFFMK